MKISPVVLCVLDGWGIAPDTASNAITHARTPNMDKYWASFPHTELGASGDSVGLPKKEPGNTETGHLNLGAGRIVYQDLARINMSIADGSFFTNKVLIDAIAHVKKNNSALHLMGLVGAGGVHSNIEHLFALIRLAKESGLRKVFIHAFTDGRDSPPSSAKMYIAKLQEIVSKEGVGEIVSVMGRYFAMDRDNRWERTKQAYEALSKGIGHHVKSIEEALDVSYESGKTDEFIEPSIKTDSRGTPLGLVGDGDAVIFFNFRIDRPRQLVKAFVSKDFEKLTSSDLATLSEDPNAQDAVSKTFERNGKIKDLFFVMMTQYDKSLVEDVARVVFPREEIPFTLGEVISMSELSQLRVGESEKEKFITYYFSGQQNFPFTLEDRIIIPSPRVSTYDKKPEMSAVGVTDAILQNLNSDKNYAFVLVNYANADMVAHSGNMDSAIKACEVVDECIGRLGNFVLERGGALIITADHGNAEQMLSKDGEVATEHSANPVPFIVVSKEFDNKSYMLSSGILADVAPTVLKLLGIVQPTNMTGRDLLAEI